MIFWTYDDMGGLIWNTIQGLFKIFSHRYGLRKLGRSGVSLDNIHLYNPEALKNLVQSKNKSFTVAIEGNIGCGKSTFLDYFEDFPDVQTFQEPVEQWTNVEGTANNALQLLYDDPSRWAFTFNNYVMLSRLKIHKQPIEKPVKMIERSLFSTRYVFVENILKSGNITSLEHCVLDKWFEYMVASQDIKVDLYVYLRAPPEACFNRIRLRNRKEETTVPFKLIEELHDLHEEWLIKQEICTVDAPVLVLDAGLDLSMLHKIYEENKPIIMCGYS